MEGVFKYFFVGFWILLFLLTLVFALVSYVENEKRAVKRSVILLFPEIILVLLFLSLNLPSQLYVYVSIGIILSINLAFLPFKTSDEKSEIPNIQFDERDIIFSRNLLKEGADKYKEYYSRRPELKKSDDLFRSKPGLLSPQSKFYEANIFNETQDVFNEVDKLHPLVDIPPKKKEPEKINKEKLTNTVLNLISDSGAVSTGITFLKKYHLYSHIGRGKDYGEKVELNQKYAIAFTVEMELAAMQYAPYAPTVLESAKQYLHAAKIAINTAEYLRNLGYEARAHIDANYRVICPLVAVDAGLGAIGRMGLLMTPELGPRVRIGVVTTNAPLSINSVKKAKGMIDFCQICKKCSDNCPVGAIPSGERQVIDNTKRWKINSESCYTYWCTVGTDCGKCMQVCPFSHPNNLLHNAVRFLIQKNPINRWMALKLDDFFYGRKIKNIIT